MKLDIYSLQEPTGIQDSTALGYTGNRSDETPDIGTIQFSNSGSDYTGSEVAKHVNNYNSYLITQGVTPIESRLITKDELIGLGCSEYDNSCSEAPSWVYATSYWSGSAYASYFVWRVFSSTGFSYSHYIIGSNFGVRPVITISRDYL